MKKFIYHAIPIILVILEGLFFIFLATAILDEFPIVKPVYKILISIGYLLICLSLMIVTTDVVIYCERRLQELK